MIVSRSCDCPYCGSGHSNSCYIEYDDGFYCYSCGAVGGSKKGQYIYKDVIVPTKYTPEFDRNYSTTALKWLYNYHLSHNDLYKYNIYSAKDSIVYIISETEYQRRFFPKNFFSTIDKSIPHILKCKESVKNTLVIVEDYISAIRVSQYVDVLCLFGTSMSKKYCDDVFSQYSKIVVWLDNDDAGINATKKIITQFETYTRNFVYLAIKSNISVIIGEKQPKELSPSKLRAILNV